MSARGLRGLLVPLIVGVTLLDITGAPLAAADEVQVVPTGRLAGLRYHVVAPGESIKAVAKRYGITVDAVRAANGMTPETWYAGARVLLDAPNPANRYPGPTPPSATKIAAAAAPAAPAPAASTYTVRSGDGFARIAKRTGTTVAALVAANGLTVDAVIQPDQQLIVPSAGPVAAPAPAAPAPTSTYVVKSGDGFARIAKRTGTTVAAILAVNGTTVDATIIPGQVISLPATAAGLAAPAPPAATPAPPGLVCPVPGSSFSYDWGFPRSDGRFHEGLDMFAPAGTPVLAPVSGTVTFTSDSLAGNAAVLNGTDTWHYFAGHLSKFGKKGQVKAGDIIGYVGSSGNADGTSPHLHLEMRPQDGRPTNPWSYMRTIC